jgi:UDP-N-acetylglucosamine--N-acetylmuramyl-(pentapeptide) pyrophosphoryl-undecaprenol N-acetylglucosamine transferase
VKKIIFACGGSGGHSYPLMAVAREFLHSSSADTNKWECAFVSSRGSIEENIIPREGHRLLLIPSGKLKGQNPVKVVLTLISVLMALVYSFVLVWREKPAFVFSAGGYAGAPFLVAAALAGVPCGILEQNRHPGLANKWMARFCKIIFLNFSSTSKDFAGQESVVVGHPYRAEISEALWADDSNWSKMPFRIFVFGGSQGAVGVNRLVSAALPHLKDLNIFIQHQTGKLDFETVKAAYKDFTQSQVEPYVYDMKEAYRAAHLVISRAGASSLAELAAAGKAALLIPLVSKDKHQEPNAQELSSVGAALCCLQPSLDGPKLADIIKDYYHGREKLRDMAIKIRSFDHPQSAAEIAKRIKEIVNV